MAKELSIFVDESGDRGGKARYYLLTLVFHDQADSIAEAVTGYEAKLARADLPNIPFHSEPLMNGHKDYEFLDIEQRKVMLAYFSSFVRKLPISYITFVYRRSQFEDPARLMERMGRDISSAMIERDCGRFPVHPTPAGVETRGTRRESSTPAPARSSPSGTTASRSPGPP